MFGCCRKRRPAPVADNPQFVQSFERSLMERESEVERITNELISIESKLARSQLLEKNEKESRDILVELIMECQLDLDELNRRVARFESGLNPFVISSGSIKTEYNNVLMRVQKLSLTDVPNMIRHVSAANACIAVMKSEVEACTPRPK